MRRRTKCNPGSCESLSIENCPSIPALWEESEYHSPAKIKFKMAWYAFGWVSSKRDMSLVRVLLVLHKITPIFLYTGLELAQQVSLRKFQPVCKLQRRNLLDVFAWRPNALLLRPCYFVPATWSPSIGPNPFKMNFAHGKIVLFQHLRL